MTDLDVEAAAAELGGEAVEALLAANRALRVDLEARVETTAASSQRMVTAEATASLAMLDRVNLGPRARLRTVAAILDRIDTDNPTMEQRVDRARDLLERAEMGLVDLAKGRFAAITDGTQLDRAIREIASALDCDVDITIDVGDVVGAELTTAYFVCAEALANVAKHAHARHVTVDVSAVAAYVLIQVIDDGFGGAVSDGPGLAGLARRITTVGGQFRVTSHKNSGTTVHATVPR